MDKDHPILIISTSKMCGACKGIKGEENGWPISKDDTISSKLPFDNKRGYRWNEDFFKTLLTAGQNDNIQRIEIIEIVYDTLSGMQENLKEFSIFSIKNRKLVVNKFKKTDEDNISYATFVEYSDNKPIWKVINKSFTNYRDSWIPSKYIGNFLYFYPGFSYCSSIIWYACIKDSSRYPLYMYVPGLKTIQKHDDHTKYTILKSNIDREYIFKDPVIIIKMIIEDKSKYHYPADHMQIHLKIINE